VDPGNRLIEVEIIILLLLRLNYHNFSCRLSNGSREDDSKNKATEAELMILLKTPEYAGGKV
jgi:hypothetical protein